MARFLGRDVGYPRKMESISFRVSFDNTKAERGIDLVVARIPSGESSYRNSCRCDG